MRSLIVGSQQTVLNSQFLILSSQQTVISQIDLSRQNSQQPHSSQQTALNIHQTVLIRHFLIFSSQQTVLFCSCLQQTVLNTKLFIAMLVYSSQQTLDSTQQTSDYSELSIENNRQFSVDSSPVHIPQQTEFPQFLVDSSIIENNRQFLIVCPQKTVLNTKFFIASSQQSTILQRYLYVLIGKEGFSLFRQLGSRKIRMTLKAHQTIHDIET